MRAALVFAAAYTVALFVYGHAVDSPLTNVYTGINLLMLAFFAVLDRWARFPPAVWWGIALVGLGNMLGGVLLVDGEPLYMAQVLGPIRYDKVFHAAAAFVCLFVAWAAVQHWAGDGRHFGGMLFITFLATMGGGAAVEIAELIGASVSDVNVGDYANNALDLVANAIGAAIGVVVVLVATARTVPTAEPSPPAAPG